MEAGRTRRRGSIPKGNSLRFVVFVCGLMCATFGMTAPVSEKRVPDGPDTVLAKLPPGTRHEFVMMPLRDGVKLATDIFLPEGDGPWPVVLIRTPYSRFVPDGLTAMDGVPSVLVCQNVRGRYGSEGTLPGESFDNEVDDSYDAIEWIAQQSWCNGRVGMRGGSGHGIAAMNALWSNAPHLRAVDVNITGDNSWLYWIYSNGVRRAFYRWLDARNLRIVEWPRPTTSPFDMNKRTAFVAERAARSKVGFTFYAGWFDLFSEASLDAFAALAPKGRCSGLMAPTGHGGSAGLNFPSIPPPPNVKGRTFRQWMTDAGSVPPERSTLQYYLMGDAMEPSGAPGNVWMTTDKWPVDHTPTSFYLQADGSLTRAEPSTEGAQVRFTYDPRNPAPSIGGHHSLGDESGPLDQRPLRDRTDIVRFTSAPLDQPLGITGKVWVDLYIGTDVPDTTFVVKLIDVYPNGYEALIRDAAFMLRYANGFDKPAPAKKGTTYKLSIDLWSTALVFNTGHRVAVHVSGSSTPAYEVHPNTYEAVSSLVGSPEAHNVLHVSRSAPSRIVLPVIPRESY